KSTLDFVARDYRQLGAARFAAHVVAGPTLADPIDPSYAWPLWVGKRWTGDYVRRESSGTELPVVARYEIDARETVTVPAGTFDCLRVWRRDAVNLEGNYLERTTIDWYAPEVGYVVRRLEGGLETVLEQRLTQAAGAAGE
ncbi:MAG: hypothetical protein AAFZ65_19145, partial [Planctomycetota bacterium]